MSDFKKGDFNFDYIYCAMLTLNTFHMNIFYDEGINHIKAKLQSKKLQQILVNSQFIFVGRQSTVKFAQAIITLIKYQDFSPEYQKQIVITKKYLKRFNYLYWNFYSKEYGEKRTRKNINTGALISLYLLQGVRIQ
jgi:hypothetical protein